jgi:hypothetical protein
MYSLIDWITNNTNAKLYDYTKIYTRKSTSKYHLTFSMSENNRTECKKWLDNGKGNVAVVFNLGRRKGKSVNPSTLKYPSYFINYPVISGDVTDLRFLDPSPFIIGLYGKGDALFDTSGFVIHKGDKNINERDQQYLSFPYSNGKKNKSASKQILLNTFKFTSPSILIKDGIDKKISLLTKPDANPKTNKGIKYGVLNYILHLSPTNESGKNLCSMASKGCAAACLHTAGNPKYLRNKIIARLTRSLIFNKEREWFIKKLQKEILAAQKRANKSNFIFALRLNGTTDIQWEKINI